MTDLNSIKGLTYLYLKGTSITLEGLLGLTTQPGLQQLHFSVYDTDTGFDKNMLCLDTIP